MDENKVFDDDEVLCNWIIPQFSYQGIKRIEIPKTDGDFSSLSGDYGFSIIKKYLPSVIAEHNKNKGKIKFLYDYYLGKQDILTKTRRYNIDRFNNNKIVENHAYRQVNFKTGYITSEQRDYTYKAGNSDNNLTYLDRYLIDCDFFAKDKQLKTWIYATGIGVTYTKPRLDIIVDNGEDKLSGAKLVRYATKEEGFNIEYNSPFDFSVVNPQDNFVVYSSGFNKEPLFCVSIVKVDISTENDASPIYANQILVETNYASFLMQSDLAFKNYLWEENKITKTIKTFRYLPMIEYSANYDRIGLIELNRDLYNSINTIRSAIADMVVDSANAILVFKNVDINGEDVQNMKKAGAIIISDSQNSKQNSQADLKTITMEIPFDGLTKYVDQLEHNCYAVAGVPLANVQVSSGGDTGQARSLGNGYYNAEIMAKSDIATLKAYDYKQLALFISICNQIPNSPVQDLYANEVDINYHLNESDNSLSIMQGMKYLYDMHFPKEAILKRFGFDNVNELSNNWDKSVNDYYEQQLEFERQKSKITTETIDVVETKNTNNDNNSQE